MGTISIEWNLGSVHDILRSIYQQTGRNRGKIRKFWTISNYRSQTFTFRRICQLFTIRTRPLHQHIPKKLSKMMCTNCGSDRMIDFYCRYRITISISSVQWQVVALRSKYGRLLARLNSLSRLKRVEAKWSIE